MRSVAARFLGRRGPRMAGSLTGTVSGLMLHSLCSAMAESVLRRIPTKYSTEQLACYTFVCIATFTLATGVAIYAVCRVEAPVFLISGMWPAPAFRGLNALTGQLPSFVHTYAFILLTAAVIPNQRRVLSICAFWVVLESVFEIAQHHVVGQAIVDTLQLRSSSTPIARITQVYLLHGTFDPFDLLAIQIGAVSAFLTCRFVLGKGARP